MKYGDIGQRTCAKCHYQIDSNYHKDVCVPRAPEIGEGVSLSDLYPNGMHFQGTRLTTKPEPSLSLLVIDLGESCVVKVEKGECAFTIGNGLWKVDDVNSGTYLIYKSFPEVKAAIDAMDEKPLPRIERIGEDDGYDLYWRNDAPGGLGFLFPSAYHALCQLAGVKIPVYEGGEWVKLSTAGTLDVAEGTDVMHFTVWRYTR